MEWIFLAVVALLGLGLALLGGFVFLRWLARLYARAPASGASRADAARPGSRAAAPETENRPTNGNNRPGSDPVPARSLPGIRKPAPCCARLWPVSALWPLSPWCCCCP